MTKIINSTIRFVVIDESLWYSLNDIQTFLKKNDLIRYNFNIDYAYRKYIAKKISKSLDQMSYNCILSIKPFDDFINWVRVPDLLEFCSPKEVQKIKNTKLIEAIDANIIEVIKENYPEIFNCLYQIYFQSDLIQSQP